MFAIPNTKMFELNKKFYPIGIVVEFPEDIGEDGDEPQDPADPAAKEPEDTNGDKNMETDSAHKEHPDAQKKSAGNKETSSDSSRCNYRKASNTSPVKVTHDSDMEELSMSDALPSHLEKARENILSWLGSDIPDEEKCYNLLREMEVVNEDGHFAYDTMEEDSVCEQQDEKQLSMTLEANPKQKEKIWGPITGTRQCSRLQKNAGIPILDLAKDIKKKRNMDIPASSKNKGTSSNPFNVFRDNSFITMAHSFGVDIENVSVSSMESDDFHISSKLDEVKLISANNATEGSLTHVPAKYEFIPAIRANEGLSVGHSPSVTPTATSFCSESPKTPIYDNKYDLELDSGQLWTKICRRRRGKHPRKIVYYE
jgi:hypothetical protein